MRDGDEFVITRLDRLARSVKDLSNIAGQLENQQVDFSVLDQNLDTKTAAGKLLFNVIGSIAEFELSLIRERAQEGIEKAKAK